MWRWRAGYDMFWIFEVRIVAKVAYIIPSFSFSVKMRDIAPVEDVSHMTSYEFLSWLLVELKMGKLGC